MLEPACRRVERLEEPVVHRSDRSGQRVQERRLADVGVAGERDRRRLGPAPRLPARVALLAQGRQSAPEQGDPATRDPAVGLELGLTGAARADAAAEALEVLPQAPHPREVVLQLGELDLELPLGAHGVLGEDVEDQLGPVDDARLEGVLEGPLLHRSELVVHDEHLRVGARVGVLQLLELPLADVGSRVVARPVLDELGHRLDARGRRELL